MGQAHLCPGRAQAGAISRFSLTGGVGSQLLRHLTGSYGPPALIHSHASADCGSCRVLWDGHLDRRTQGWGVGTEAAELGREGALLGGRLEGHRRASKDRERGPRTAAGAVAERTLGL